MAYPGQRYGQQHMFRMVAIRRIVLRLLALLENARRHAVPGSMRIQTRVEQRRCYLRVQDERPAIAAEFVPDVFTAFRRADDSRSRESGGSGLRLAVVSHHCARPLATYRSALGSGNCFELSWPAE
jgi:two-component system sensor histidine kinase AdeS